MSASWLGKGACSFTRDRGQALGGSSYPPLLRLPNTPRPNTAAAATRTNPAMRTVHARRATKWPHLCIMPVTPFVPRKFNSAQTLNTFGDQINGLQRMYRRMVAQRWGAATRHRSQRRHQPEGDRPDPPVRADQSWLPITIRSARIVEHTGTIDAPPGRTGHRVSMREARKRLVNSSRSRATISSWMA